MNAIVRAVGLRRHYREPGGGLARALDGVDLELHAGRSLAIVGESGSGKSTLLHLIGLLDRPTGGQIFLRGHDVAGLGDRERARLRRVEIGFVFQRYNLLPRLSALENVTLPLRLRRRGEPTVSDARDRAADALASVGLGDKLRRPARKLSGGEQQRVAVARAIACRPSVVLADEPTGNLDDYSADAVIDLLDALRERGAAVAIVTHSARVAARVPEQLVLRAGRRFAAVAA